MGETGQSMLAGKATQRHLVPAMLTCSALRQPCCLHLDSIRAGVGRAALELSITAKSAAALSAAPAHRSFEGDKHREI